MVTKIPFGEDIFNYQKIWRFAHQRKKFKQFYPNNTLLFQVGSYYFATGLDAMHIYIHDQIDAGDFCIHGPDAPDPFIIEQRELYRYIGIMSESEYPIRIIHDAELPIN